MRAGDVRRLFLKHAGRDPGGWNEVWSAFVSVLREPIDDQEVLADLAQFEVVPPRPSDVNHMRVRLSRVLGIAGPDPDVDLEAGLYVTALWSAGVDIGSEIIEVAGKGPSSYEHDPLPGVDEFAAIVSRLGAVAKLKRANAAFLSLDAWYKRPSEPD
jgi:hypothetical protein